MEHQVENNHTKPEPAEVVEVYRHPEPQEVVEVYTRPLSWLAQKPPAPKKRSKKGLWIFLGCLSVVAVLAVIGWFVTGSADGDAAAERDKDPFEWYYEEDGRTEQPDEITIPAVKPGPNVRLNVTAEHGEELPLQEIYRRVNPAVVTVMAQVEDALSVGTGVMFTENGYLVTNYHVVEGGSDCLVMFENGYSCDAMYVAGDAGHDLAILKVEETGVLAAEFGDSDELMVGDPAHAIGNPLGVELRGTLTSGIISAINRDVWVDGRTMTLIQTDAALNTGNSGGPLINRYGQVVGLNVIKMSSSHSNIEGLGFAIPSASMDRMVNDLLKFGEIKPEPLLGITVISVAEEPEEGVRGLRVQSVTKGGAGDTAGVRAGDFVLSANGEPLETSQDLLRIRRSLYVGDELDLLLWRDGKEIEVTLHLTESVDDTKTVYVNEDDFSLEDKQP